MNPNEALKFAFRNLKDPKLPVFFQIKFTPGEYQPSYFQLNNGNFTMFPQENEVLLYDGDNYLLEDVDMNADV